MTIREKANIPSLSEFRISQCRKCPNDGEELKILTGHMEWHHYIEIVNYKLKCPKCGYVLQVRRRRPS
jgi:C4-type Zn-finger protein